VRQLKSLGVLLLLAGVTGCADGPPGDTQIVMVDTQPRTGAQCTLQNDRGSWNTMTPASVALARSTAPLTVSCRTPDGLSGAASIQAGSQGGASIDAIGAGAAASDLYPERIAVTLAGTGMGMGAMAASPSYDQRPRYGIDGGRGIPGPLDPLADRERMAEDNMVTRFQALRVLLDEGLITRDEYNTRRGANLGALLRYSVVPPARDLSRPPPQPDALVQRLRYLASAYAEHSISAGEQAAERAVILDGLLPAVVKRRADPPPPITDEMAVAAEIGLVERLRDANVITDAEATKEKLKAAQLLDASIAASDAAARAAAGMAAGAGPSAGYGSGVGVALSTHNSEAQARRAWAALQKAHPSELGQLGLSLKKIPRPHRPTHYQIVAGPVPDHEAAISLCKSLRKHDLSCDAARYGE